MNSDTDGDGVSDGKEVQFGTDPLNSDADTIVYTEESENIEDDKNVFLKINAAAQSLQSLKVQAIPEASLISPSRITGMLGQGISFTMAGEFDIADVEIELESEDYDPSLSYGLYYINEQTAEFERLDNQEINYGRITATLEHFSNYAVISDDEIVAAQKSLKRLFLPGENEYWNDEDIDGDGFNNAEDPTPYSADRFKTYEDYLRYFFPNSDVASMIVRVPQMGSSTVYSFSGNGSGHSWMGYWHGTKSGNEEYSELAGFGSTASQAQAVTALKKGLESWVKMWTKIRFLKTNGSIVDYFYADFGDCRETEGYMSLALPFVTIADTYSKYTSFINNYRELYNLYNNNCTTFMLKAFDSMGIESKVTGNVPPSVYENDDLFSALSLNVGRGAEVLGQAIMSDACSPGQAGYCIYKYYNYNFVIHDTSYQLKNGNVTDAYYSNMSSDLASFSDVKNSNQIQDTSLNISSEVSSNGHTYRIYDEGLTWRAAEAWCEENGGHLATITSQEEQDIIEQLLINGTKNSYWLGGLSTTTGRVVWVTGEEDSYKHWSPGQPDDYNGNENAMMMYRNRNPLSGGSGFGLWNDLLEDGTCNSEEFFGMNNFGFIYECE